MPLTNSVFLNIKEILLAHEYFLDHAHRCEYPHGRGHYGLVYVLNGQGEYCFCDGERIAIGDGDTLFLSKNAAYSIVTAKGIKHYTVNFDIHEDASRIGSFNAPYCLLKKEEPERIERSFKKLVGVWKAKKNGFEMEAMGCLYELLSVFCFGYTNLRNSAAYQRLLPAKEYIEQRFDQPITLEELARLSDMSVTNFRREWKKIYSDTPLQYRDSLRIYYAKEFLNSGYYTVSEIAEKCGFYDVSYFAKFFKKQTGISPKAYKKQMIGA